MESIFTARKRSLQRLYVFTGVCLSTWGEITLGIRTLFMCGGGHVTLSIVAGGHVWQGRCMCDRRVCLAGGVSQGAYVAGGMNGGGARMCVYVHAWQGGARDRRDCHCSGRYASYWNAFLLRNICTEITIFYTCHVKYISSASVNPMLLTIPITVQRWGSQFCPLRWDSAVQHV